MFDYHIHTSFSDDARSTLDEVLATAMKKGLDGIAVTDHFDPFYYDDEYPWVLDLPAYEAALAGAERTCAGKLSFAKGIEIGLIEGEGLAVCEETLSGFPFDFVIASVHHTARAPIHTPEFLRGRTQQEIVEEYFTALLTCIRQYKNYDVLGHLNVIDRYMDSYAPAGLYMDTVREILLQAIGDGKGIELNVSTFRYGMADHGTPTPAILALYRELGGEIVTIGSDAHEARYVGAFIKEGEDILRAHGFRYVTTYRNRAPSFHSL
ncbi:MAG: histidinol-phosphatase HisJ family protein [Clostridiales Family XIII bacterium]|jgi:histidinol-phosphatase (PHP family)|nr:histidinol-phosphatase HisJ family protein [Clostridiales Family XIII bacterium]